MNTMTEADLRGRESVTERTVPVHPGMLRDGLLLLAGLWLAISPWVLHFDAWAPGLRASNLLFGAAIAVIGVGLTLAPERVSLLSWAIASAGGWVVVSQWLILRWAATSGVILNNVITGALIFCLGAASASVLSGKPFLGDDA